MTNPNWHFETKQLHIGQEQADPATGARAVPIYQTTSYVFHNSDHAAALFDLSAEGDIYSRMSNPTQNVLEQRLAALEGGVAALAFASGSAAIAAAIQGLAKAGQHVVAATSLYGGTYNLLAHTLPEYGITCTFVDSDDPATFAAAIQPNTRALYLESLGNPNANLADIEAIARIAHAHGLPLLVDNTFATPYLLRPIEHGADIVIHSATKFIGGHGTSLGGVVIDGGRFDWRASGKFPAISQPNESYHGVCFTEAFGAGAYAAMLRCLLLRDLGACLSPFNAFLLLQGLETLSLRVERHVTNAMQVVEYLNRHPKVERVNHPSLAASPYNALYRRYFPLGAGSIFTFDIKGGREAAKHFADSLRVFSLLANVADVKSLVIHPASTTHAQLTAAELAEQAIGEGTVRLSVGCEHIDDILADLEQALAQA